MSASGEDPRLGQIVLDRYRITRLIAIGGMGAVYEAEHVRIGRRVAVKFLRPELREDEKTLARFEQEATVAGALENENVCAMLDLGSGPDGSPCLVMEYLKGQSLDELLRAESPIPAVRAVAIVQQVCRGLRAAHARGVIHRDLKPKNLLVERDAEGRDRVKIVDFGIAKQAAKAGPTTTTGATMGTPHYMSPEQARGEKKLDARTDIYALGVILYELLTGEKPHPGDSYNAIIYHILSKDPRPIEELRPELPHGLSRLVHRALASDPEARFASADELLRALAPYGPSGLPPLASDAETQSGTAIEAEGRPNARRQIIFAFILGTSVSAVAAVALTSRSDDVAPPLPEPPTADAFVASPLPAKTSGELERARAWPPASASASVLERPAPARKHKAAAVAPAASSAAATAVKTGFEWQNPYQ